MNPATEIRQVGAAGLLDKMIKRDEIDRYCKNGSSSYISRILGCRLRLGTNLPMAGSHFSSSKGMNKVI